MLELKTYSIQEMSDILGSKTKKQIDGKLKRYDVEFESKGRGNDLVYTIQRINDPFKVFCIIELGFAAQSDFIHLRHFLYHFLCDDYFMSMPDEVKEHMMDEAFNYHISRQTITNYEKKLAKKGYVSLDGEYYYYFAYKKKQIMTTEEIYKSAWRKFWFWISLGASSDDAKFNIITTYGGMPMKHQKIEKNAFYLKKIDYLIELIRNSIDNDLI